MTLPTLMRLVRDIAHRDSDGCTYMQMRNDVESPELVVEGLARGLLESATFRPRNQSVRLTPAGLRWCRAHPLPRRRLRVYRVQR